MATSVGGADVCGTAKSLGDNKLSSASIPPSSKKSGGSEVLSSCDGENEGVNRGCSDKLFKGSSKPGSRSDGVISAGDVAGIDKGGADVGGALVWGTFLNACSGKSSSCSTSVVV